LFDYVYIWVLIMLFNKIIFVDLSWVCTKELICKKMSWSVYAIHFCNEKLYVGNFNKINVFDCESCKELPVVDARGGFIWDIASSLDGSVLYVACNDGTGRCVDLATRRVVTLSGHDGYVRCIISGDDGIVFTCGVDKTVKMWESQSGKNIKTFTAHGYAFYSILYTGKEKRLFSGSRTSIIIWDIHTGIQVGVMNGHSDTVRSLAWVDDRTIVSGSWDNTLKIWDLKSFTCLRTFSGHNKSVISVAVTVEGLFIISGAFDKTTKVWRTNGGECVHTLTHHSGGVEKVTVSADGRFLATGGGFIDQMFHLFQVEPGFCKVIISLNLY
jgi:WD40 repeat protein